jgi:hypothetical protein
MPDILIWLTVNSLIAFTAWNLAVFFPHIPRFISTAFIWPCIVAYISILFGFAGLLNTLDIALGSSLLTAFSYWLKVRHQAQGSPCEKQAQFADQCEYGPAIWVFVSATLAYWLAKTWFSPTYFAVDCFTYHTIASLRWLEEGAIELPTSPFEHYPHTPQALASLMQLLSGRFAEAGTGFVGSYFGVMLALATAHLSILLGAQRFLAMAIFGLVLLTPQIAHSAQTFAAVDLVGPASFLAAVSVFLFTKRLSVPEVLLGGSLLGLAIGSKVSFGPIAVVLSLIVWWRNGWRSVPLLLLTCGSLGGVWYIRNWILTGNPFYPGSFGPLEGMWSSDYLRKTTAAFQIGENWHRPSTWIEIFRFFLNWPLGMAFIALAGFATAVLRFRKIKYDYSLIALLVFGLIFLVLHMATPFSGSNMGAPSFRLDQRFIIFPFLIGYVCFAAFLPPKYQQYGLTGIALAGLTGFRGLSLVSTFLVVATPAIAALIGWILHSQTNRAKLCTTALLMVASALILPLRQQKTEDFIATHRVSELRLGEIWSQVGKLPKNSTIAFMYPSSEDYPIRRHTKNAVRVRDLDELSQVSFEYFVMGFPLDETPCGHGELKTEGLEVILSEPGVKIFRRAEKDD